MFEIIKNSGYKYLVKYSHLNKDDISNLKIVITKQCFEKISLKPFSYALKDSIKNCSFF